MNHFPSQRPSKWPGPVFIGTRRRVANRRTEISSEIVGIITSIARTAIMITLQPRGLISASLTTSAVLGVVPLLTLIDIVYLKDIGRIFIEPWEPTFWVYAISIFLLLATHVLLAKFKALNAAGGAGDVSVGTA
mgnify:CR=1 FL=1